MNICLSAKSSSVRKVFYLFTLHSSLFTAKHRFATVGPSGLEPPTEGLSLAAALRFPTALRPLLQTHPSPRLSHALEESTRSLLLSSVFVEFRITLVGPSGLEPPTSCLSGTRSNLLSYEPMWLVSDFCHLNFSFLYTFSLFTITFYLFS